MSIEAVNLFFAYQKEDVLKDINFRADSGELIAFLGPNGVGKTTFFKCLLGFLKPHKGEVLIDGKNIESYSRKELASQIAYIPQSYNPAFNHTVIDSVLMGMANKLGYFESPGACFKDKAMEVLDSLGIADLANRGSIKISGGERQLMLLARALVQDAHVLIMDEPTANLDFGNSYRVMERIARLREQGYSILFSTHDPNQATRWASRIVALHESSVYVDTPVAMFDPKTINTLYGVNASVCGHCGSVIIEK